MTSKINVLYVDDEEINLFLFQRLMAQHFEVTTAISGAKALKILEIQPELNVVISDMNMPMLNGLEFIKKAQEIFNNKKYIIISAYIVNDEITNALEEGVIEKFLPKPFDVNIIVTNVNEVLGINP